MNIDRKLQSFNIPAAKLKDDVANDWFVYDVSKAIISSTATWSILRLLYNYLRRKNIARLNNREEESSLNQSSDDEKLTCDTECSIKLTVKRGLMKMKVIILKQVASRAVVRPRIARSKKEERFLIMSKIRDIAEGKITFDDSHHETLINFPNVGCRWCNQATGQKISTNKGLNKSKDQSKREGSCTSKNKGWDKRFCLDIEVLISRA